MPPPTSRAAAELDANKSRARRLKAATALSAATEPGSCRSSLKFQTPPPSRCRALVPAGQQPFYLTPAPNVTLASAGAIRNPSPTVMWAGGGDYAHVFRRRRVKRQTPSLSPYLLPGDVVVSAPLRWSRKSYSGNHHRAALDRGGPVQQCSSIGHVLAKNEAGDAHWRDVFARRGLPPHHWAARPILFCLPSITRKSACSR